MDIWRFFLVTLPTTSTEVETFTVTFRVFSLMAKFWVKRFLNEIVCKASKESIRLNQICLWAFIAFWERSLFGNFHVQSLEPIGPSDSIRFESIQFHSIEYSFQSVGFNPFRLIHRFQWPFWERSIFSNFHVQISLASEPLFEPIWFSNRPKRHRIDFWTTPEFFGQLQK